MYCCKSSIQWVVMWYDVLLQVQYYSGLCCGEMSCCIVQYYTGLCFGVMYCCIRNYYSYRLRCGLTYRCMHVIAVDCAVVRCIVA